jgi:hypothetical protein
VDAAGQNVLEESADEFPGLQGHRLPAGCTGVLVAEDDLAIVGGQDAAVGDGDAVDVMN